MALMARKIDLDLLGVVRGAIALVIDPSKTESVYDVEDGLRHRRATTLAVEFVKQDPGVAQIFAERYLAEPPDLEQLGQLPEGALGRVYADYLRDSGFEADFYRSLEVEDDASYFFAANAPDP